MTRLIRFTLVLGQLSLITILIWICYSKTGNDFFGNSAEDRSFVVAFILSFATLPLPRGLLKCFETKIYVLKE